MGDAATDNVVFGADVDSNIIPDDDDTYDLGSSTQQWRNLFIDGTAEIDTLAINGTAVTSTAAEINLLDGSTANTVVNSKAVVYGSSGELAGALSTTAQPNVTSLGTLTTLTVDDITINGSTISDAGDLTLDVAGDIILDADGGDVYFKDAGTTIFQFKNTDSSNADIYSLVADKDLRIIVNDGGSNVNALVFDASEAGKATFNNAVVASGVSQFADVNIPDNNAIRFGNSQDLQIYHDGTNSSIQNATGELFIYGGTDEIRIRAKNDEESIVATPNGAVTVYYDGSAKLATTNTGIDVTGTAVTDGLTSSGDLVVDDGTRSLTYDVSAGELNHAGATFNINKTNGVDVAIGNDDFYVDMSASRVGIGTTSPQYTLHVLDTIGTRTLTLGHGVGEGVITTDSAKDLDFQQAGTTKMTLDSSGNLVFPGDVTLDAVGDIILDADGGDIRFSDGGTQFGIVFKSSNDLALFSTISDGDLLFRGNDGGSNITALTLDMSDAGTAIFNHDVKLGDNGKAVFGAGSDLQIYHDGSNSIVADTGTGDLFLAGTQLRLTNGGRTATYLQGTDGGAVDIRYNNSSKLATTNTGIDVTGTVELDNITVSGAQGNDGQVLTSTGSGIAWEDAGSGGATSLNGLSDAKTFGTGSIMIGDTTTGTIDAANNNTGLGVDVFAALTSGDDNTAVGKSSLAANTTGASNTAIGHATLTANTTGTNSVAIGSSALISNTTGNQNVAIGFNSLDGNTVGDRAVAIGSYTLTNQAPSSNVDTYNVAVGYGAGNDITTATLNTLIGGLAGDALTTGSDNVAIGYEALSTEDAHGSSVAVGMRALKTQNAGAHSYNVGVGKGAGQLVTTGAYNTFIGGQSGDATTTGNNNTAVGYASLGANTTGTSNTALGRESLDANTTGNNNTGLGSRALGGNTTGDQNTAVGERALEAATTADDNTAMGYLALQSATTGGNNTAFGSSALKANTTGNTNVAVGQNTLEANTVGDRNVGVGYQALILMNPSSNEDTYNVAMGYRAGAAVTTGVQNTFIGGLAGDANTTSSENTAVGWNSLGANTTGGANTAVGKSALASNTTAADNVAFGQSALLATTTGGGNVAVGKNAGDIITTGTGNTALGNLADVGASGAVNRIALGNQVTVSSNNRISVGAGSNIASLELNASDTSWAASSDERLKENIISSTAGLSFINDLRPVTYNWKKAKDVPNDLPQYINGSDEPCLGHTYGAQLHGFIAQEVKTVLDNHSEVKDGQGIWQTDETTVQTLAPSALVPMLVKAIQELSAKVDELQQ